jgi:hypothetical protein
MKEKMKHKENKGTVKLELTEEQFLVINELLFNVELGDRNGFESAISDLMVEMDNDVNKFAINQMVAKHGKPEISVVAENDGFSIRVE